MRFESLNYYQGVVCALSDEAEQEFVHYSPPSRDVHRHTFKVPHVDVSVEAWWNTQFDATASLNALIRAEIERHGITDTMHRPVAEQILNGSGS